MTGKEDPKGICTLQRRDLHADIFQRSLRQLPKFLAGNGISRPRVQASVLRGRRDIRRPVLPGLRAHLRGDRRKYGAIRGEGGEGEEEADDPGRESREEALAERRQPFLCAVWSGGEANK